MRKKKNKPRVIVMSVDDDSWVDENEEEEDEEGLDPIAEDIRINQRNPADCAVCALCMFLGVDYNDFIGGFPFLSEKIQSVRTGGLNKDVMMQIAATVRGRPMMIMYNHYDYNNKRKKDIFKMFAGVPAVMSAMSLNYPGVAHAVYWDGEKIHDHSNKNKYTKRTIRPYEIMF